MYHILIVPYFNWSDLTYVYHTLRKTLRAWEVSRGKVLVKNQGRWQLPMFIWRAVWGLHFLYAFQVAELRSVGIYREIYLGFIKNFTTMRELFWKCNGLPLKVLPRLSHQSHLNWGWIDILGKYCRENSGIRERMVEFSRFFPVVKFWRSVVIWSIREERWYSGKSRYSLPDSAIGLLLALRPFFHLNPCFSCVLKWRDLD